MTRSFALLLVSIFVGAISARAGEVAGPSCNDFFVPPCETVAARDVVFLVDTSESLNRDTFYSSQLNLVQYLYCGLNQDQTNRAALVTFSRTVSVPVPFRAFSAPQWFSAVDSVRGNPKICCSCCTPLPEAFAAAKAIFDKAAAPHGERTVLVITDGEPYQNAAGGWNFPRIPMAKYMLEIAPQQAQLLKQMSIPARVFLVGIPNKDGVPPQTDYFVGIPNPNINGGPAFPPTRQCFKRGIRTSCGFMNAPPFPLVSQPTNENVITIDFDSDLQPQIYAFVDKLCGVEVTSAPTTLSPTASPTAAPTSKSPTLSPSKAPTSESPTTSPTKVPTSKTPTYSPSKAPSSKSPTASPTKAPTSKSPSRSPSKAPSSKSPTASPTKAPTSKSPSRSPSKAPSSKSPTTSPTKNPTSNSPTLAPSAFPTTVPTSPQPTLQPTAECVNVGDMCDPGRRALHGIFEDDVTNGRNLAVVWPCCDGLACVSGACQVLTTKPTSAPTPTPTAPTLTPTMLPSSLPTLQPTPACAPIGLSCSVRRRALFDNEVAPGDRDLAVAFPCCAGGVCVSGTCQVLTTKPTSAPTPTPTAPTLTPTMLPSSLPTLQPTPACAPIGLSCSVRRRALLDNEVAPGDRNLAVAFPCCAGGVCVSGTCQVLTTKPTSAPTPTPTAPTLTPTAPTRTPSAPTLTPTTPTLMV